MDEVLHRLSKLFQALGNGVRLQLLKALQAGEAHVGALSDQVERSPRTVSHHLKILRDNNLVLSRTEGRKRYYQLKRPNLIRACLGLTEYLAREED